MELVAGPPTHWRVVLLDGSVVEVWADAVEGLAGPEDQRDYSFGCLMDIDPALQGEFEVTARTPSNPRRVEVLVARFPRATVRDIHSH
jgi:hypothetical protein